MKGLILVDRSILDHHIVGTSNDRIAMWLWMLAAASWRERRIFVSGKEIVLQRGQFFASIRTISTENRVSKGVAERFIRDLKSVTMIETQSETGGSIVTICKYDQYQSFDEYRETASGTDSETATGQSQDSDGTATGHKRTPLTPSTHSTPLTPEGDQGDFSTNDSQQPVFNLGEESGNVVRPKKFSKREAERLLLEEFDQVWPHYPRNASKADAEKAWIKARKKASFEEITGPLGEFIRLVRGQTEKRFIPHFSTWLNKERWNDNQRDATNRPMTSDERLDGLMQGGGAPQVTSDDRLNKLFPQGSQSFLEHQKGGT